MTVVLDSTVSPSDDAVFRELEGESVLLNLETGMYYGLDPVGTRAWQLAEAGRSLRAVRDALVEEYDAEPAIIEHDLLALADALIGKGLWTLK
jgi:coenzyme PQQ synthesis protein D (PqqD)